jgi:hypothetical protein
VSKRNRRSRKHYKTALAGPCESFLRDLASLRDLAQDHGLTVKVNNIDGHGKTVLHVMFDFHGERVLNYWPSTGRTWDGHRRGKVLNWWDALDKAADIASNNPALWNHRPVAEYAACIDTDRLPT